MSGARNSIRPKNRRHSDDSSRRRRRRNGFIARLLSATTGRRELTFHFNIVIVHPNGCEFHAANLLLRLLCQQAMLHGSFHAITKRRQSLSFRFHPRELSGTCVGFLFIPPRSFLHLRQCAIGIPGGVYRCAKLAPKSSDQNASYSSAAHTLIPFGFYERNTCNSNFETFSLQDSHSLCF